MDATADVARSVQFEDEDIQDHGSEGDGDEDEEDEYEEKADKDLGEVETTAELLQRVEELQLQVGKKGVPRPVERNQAAELDDDGDDDDEDQRIVPGERPPLVPKATRNADTPSANKVLARLGEEMRTQSEWMMIFAPVAMAQAKWPVLGPELTQPVNSTSINQLVEDTVLLLRAMGYRCTSRPNSLILAGWSLARAGAELMQRKRKPRTAFNLERATGGQPTIARRIAESPKLSEDPSKVPLPKTPDTKKRDVFRATQGTTYYEDSHMRSPVKPTRSTMARYRELYDVADEAELGDADEEYNYQRKESDESVKDYIQTLSAEAGDTNRSPYLEVRSHVSLDKITAFEGKRYRSDDSLQWLKRFIYEMKGAHISQNAWCEPFSLCLGRAAKSWFRQLPKKAQHNWKPLSEAFLDYYCAQFDQSARTRYYSARRKENEAICDFLIRLNGYARTAKIRYEKGGADAADHVEHFLLNCGDDEVMDLLYPLQLRDIQQVDQIINRKILGEKRKKQRDRLVTSQSREGRRGDSSRGRDVRRDATGTRPTSAQALQVPQAS